MHERGLARGILQAVQDAAPQDARVVAVTIEVATEPGLSIGHLRAQLQLVAQGTTAEDAAILITPVAGVEPGVARVKTIEIQD